MKRHTKVNIPMCLIQLVTDNKNCHLNDTCFLVFLTRFCPFFTLNAFSTVYTQVLKVVHKEFAFLCIFAFPFFGFCFLVKTAFWWSKQHAIIASGAELRLCDLM